jgi:ribosome biogenesis protein ERB1
LLCFDLDLSAKPYKSMTFHEKGVTSIDYHPEYPLMASASNDATIHVFHFKGQTETLQEAIILPLKVLRGHSIRSLEGVKSIKFHPKQPWIISAGKDGKLLLWT